MQFCFHPHPFLNTSNPPKSFESPQIPSNLSKYFCEGGGDCRCLPKDFSWIPSIAGQRRQAAPSGQQQNPGQAPTVTPPTDTGRSCRPPRAPCRPVRRLSPKRWGGGGSARCPNAGGGGGFFSYGKEGRGRRPPSKRGPRPLSFPNEPGDPQLFNPGSLDHRHQPSPSPSP